ncbi:hypothetical protein CGCS363_v013152 [Colletotrichum siamense]|uniref:uncharacterized protein n=1 Tax=Colletotrichum siamense TaxID=690259 RepID=UPI001872DAF5|nr:uncharacterized protein CGCS363_v013152 [Colletotrichum siamense]KAF5486909.1 hypothetical protein CGCS363_v013152 [Colletotrichum siamense]
MPRFLLQVEESGETVALVCRLFVVWVFHGPRLRWRETCSLEGLLFVGVVAGDVTPTSLSGRRAVVEKPESSNTLTNKRTLWLQPATSPSTPLQVKELSQLV